MTNINDQEIKDYIERYQNGEDYLENILNLIGEFIYNYPRICHKQDADGCSDFFLYVCDRLAQVLKKYKRTSTKFTSWLLVVLKNHYLNWVGKKKKVHKDCITFDETIKYDFTEKRLPLYLEDENKENEVLFNEIKKIINLLPKKVRIIVKLHYYDFFDPLDIQFIADVFNYELDFLSHKFQEINNVISSQYQKRIELMDQITSTFQRIQELQKYPKEEEKDFLNKLKKRQVKLMDKYKSFYISIDNKTISELLKINKNAVHNLLFRGRRELSKKLKNKVVQSV